MTNKEFAKTDENFRSLCKKLDVEPTKRQASKFRMKKGIVWKSRNKENKNGE